MSSLAGNARDLDGRFVHVGDLAFRADRHQRVQAGLDQAAGVLRTPAAVRVTSRAAAKTPSTLPCTSRYTEAL